ncbi:hypothetical protein ACHQM5_001412 [Ranunculus cassubicifolius]
MSLHILYMSILLLCWVGAVKAVDSVVAEPSCNRKCGNITILYPFGYGNSSECYKDENFQLTCSESRLFTGDIPMVNMSLEEGTATVDLYASYNCNDEPKYKFRSETSLSRIRPFRFSNTRNMFTVIGCNTIAQIKDPADGYASGCLSLCEVGTTPKNLEKLTRDVNSCSGVGCCQTPIPQGLKELKYELKLYDHDNSSYNPCSFGNMTCEEAKKTGNKSVYICGPNTNCIDSKNGPGYRCACNKGFDGNPYVTETDIDECKSTHGENRYTCKGTCKNNPGNYTCDCPFGYHGDGKVGCSMKHVIKVLIGVGSLFVFVTSILTSLWLYKKRIQRSNHLKNGGLLLDQLTVRIFKEAQLEKATDNFDSKKLLGEGGNGWVYGTLPDMTVIAVKKSKAVDKNQIEQFLNEADIVSKINYKHVVRLLGVCLDSKVPMLVYEYVAQGNLYQHIHGKNSRILDTWRICLRIAAETARALEYMHSLAYPPIIHRDVKSSNILLDSNYTAKVSDFGASKLTPMDRTMAPAQGQGTVGYMDPEYLQTGELTTMSDVYGFGVVLMELLSKQRPISRRVSGEKISLVKVFSSAVENNRLNEVLKVGNASEHETEQLEVADILNGLNKEYTSFPVEENGDEAVGFVDDQDVMTTSVTFEFESSGTM